MNAFRQTGSSVLASVSRWLSSLIPLLQVIALLLTVVMSWTTVENVPQGESSGRKGVGSKMRMTLYSVDAVSCVVSTIALRAASYTPLLKLPWLMLTMQGLLLRQGSCILNLASSILGTGWGPGLAFLTLCVTTYCEQVALWLKVAGSFVYQRPEWTLLKLLRRTRGRGQGS